MKNRITIITILTATVVAGSYVILKPASQKCPPRHVLSGLPLKYVKIANRKPSTYLIKDVSLIPVDRDTITEDCDAVDQSTQPVIIDGSGQYLRPGLSDCMLISMMTTICYCSWLMG